MRIIQIGLKWNGGLPCEGRYVLSLIRVRFNTTTRDSIDLSIFIMNINHLAGDILRPIFLELILMIKLHEKLPKFQHFSGTTKPLFVEMT